MGTYAANTDIQTRMPAHPWSGSSKPSTTDLTNWITLTEGQLTAALKAGGISTPITDADGIQLAKAIICEVVEGLARLALNSAVDASDAQIGNQRVKDFNELLKSVAAGGSSIWAAMLGGTSRQCGVRGHVINNADGETIADGDFDPEFERDEVW